MNYRAEIKTSNSVLGAKAFADEKVGEFAGSGLIFKDTVEVKALEDPDGREMAAPVALVASVRLIT